MLAILLIRYLNKKEFAFENSFYFLMVYALFVAMSALFPVTNTGWHMVHMNFLSLYGLYLSI